MHRDSRSASLCLTTTNREKLVGKLKRAVVAQLQSQAVGKPDGLGKLCRPTLWVGFGAAASGGRVTISSHALVPTSCSQFLTTFIGFWSSDSFRVSCTPLFPGRRCLPN